MSTFRKFWETAVPKVLIIMRGVSGAGKSTRAKQLAGPTGAIFSTDNFFGSGADYAKNYNIERLPEAHQWNQKQTEEALQKGVTPVIIDNTNIMPYEAKSYILLGQKYGYEVKIEEPQSDEWQQILALHQQKQALAKQLAARNLHGAPPERVGEMISQYSPYSVDDALNSKAPWE
jgi:NEDD4-binding protein 2